MVITRENRITKIIEFNNRCNGLPRPFTLMKLIVQAMMLIIAEVPNINNRVQNVMKLMKNQRFRRESRLLSADADVRVCSVYMILSATCVKFRPS